MLNGGSLRPEDRDENWTVEKNRAYAQGFSTAVLETREADAALVRASEDEVASAIVQYFRAGYGPAEARTIAVGVCSDLASKIRGAA